MAWGQGVLVGNPSLMVMGIVYIIKIARPRDGTQFWISQLMWAGGIYYPCISRFYPPLRAPGVPYDDIVGMGEGGRQRVKPRRARPLPIPRPSIIPTR